MLHIYTSNRLERLAQLLVALIKTPLPNPLEKEIIVVQSRGMERWLSMTLAEHFGIWANGLFPFTDAIVWRLFKDALGYLPDTSPFEREVMTWSLMELLPDLLAKREFTELQNYLLPSEPGMKLFQLVWRIAELFDQYSVYRPDWLATWEQDEQPSELQDDAQAAWQALLWQALIKRHGNGHRAKLRHEFFTQLSQSDNKPRFCKRLALFGISALPPFHLDVFTKLGQAIDVNIFILNPCQEYWGDILSDSEIAHRTIRFKEQPKTPEELHLEKGNSLLASMGKMGRDFMDMLNEYPHTSHEHFDVPGEDSLLHTIQTDLLYLREPNEPKLIVNEPDKSIQIHICHSPLRELEVLHDQLLALFETKPTLLPKDILVMIPDIESYAPFIEAVFATTSEKKKQIPFSIADRSLRSQSALIDTFFALLELCQSRLTVSQVLHILEATTVQKHFGLREQDLELIRHWIKATHIRWGMDATAKERLNLPPYEENTWRAGLKRLLLGYALTYSERQLGTNDLLFQDILPFNAIEGNGALVLGKLAAFLEKLFGALEVLEQAYPLAQWATLLTQLVDDFFTPDDASEMEVQQLRRCLHKMAINGNQAAFNTSVTLEVVITYLRHYLELEPQPTDFLTGKVLFAAMLPMRSIPFQVICLLGMNDHAYPRANKTLGFDLITKHPQRGDRSRRQNDRYLFLETLLSARSYFYLSYVGQSIHDNSVIPPSVLISELQDYLNKHFTHATQDILNLVITSHPLQAFSPKYFNRSHAELFSYSQEYCTASSTLLKIQANKAPLISKPFLKQRLPEPQPVVEWKTLDVNRITRFFTHPTQFFLKERLGVELPTPEKVLVETEPFTLDGLERYQLNQLLLEKMLAGVNMVEYQKVIKASGQLPHGKIGDYLYRELLEQLQPFVEQLRQITRQEKLESPPLQLTCQDFKITGYLRSIWRSHLIHYRYTKVKAKDQIRIWLHHLLLNALATDRNYKQLPRYSLLFGEGKCWEYLPINNSQEVLCHLLTNYYWQGLQQPLLFFPETSLTLVEKAAEKEVMRMTKEVWQGDDFSPKGEAYDEYYQVCFHSLEENMPFQDDHFKKLAEDFYQPLLEHRQAYSFS
jgi:exodeoxyribonuclease V gamma subunit